MLFADVGPGRWLGWVQDEDETGFAAFTLDVKPFDTVVERQIVIGPPGAVIVELDLSAIPRESHPGQVKVKMVRYGGSEPFDLDRRPCEARLERVPPDTDVTLELDSSEVFGRTTVRVGMGETKRVRIRAQARAFFGIMSNDRLPEGWVHLAIEDARGQSIHEETSRINGGSFQYSGRLPPGKIRWTLHFRAGHRRLMPADVRGAATPGVQILRGTEDLDPNRPIDYALRSRDGLLRTERD